MKINELRERESYAQNLQAMFEGCDAWDRALGGAVALDARMEGLETWYEHGFFSVYVRPDFCPQGRQWLVRQYRRSPQKRAAFVRSLGVTALGSQALFGRFLSPALDLPKRRNAQACMWMPGNQRVRLFDFEHRTVRVFPKVGFDPQGIQREVELRMRYAKTCPWMLPITRVVEKNANSPEWGGAHDGAFEEPLLEASPLDRVEPKRQAQAMAQCIQAVHALHKLDQQRMCAADYLDQKQAQFEAACGQIHGRYPGICLDSVRRVWQESAQIVRLAPGVQTSLTHGDLQPGNVLVSSEDPLHVWLIDWEDALPQRATLYDALVWDARLRQTHTLNAQTELHLDAPLWDDCRCDRTLALALGRIEEWIWSLTCALRPGLTRMPEQLKRSLRHVACEMPLEPRV